jgi:hypothetical protein
MQPELLSLNKRCSGAQREILNVVSNTIEETHVTIDLREPMHFVQ